MKYFALLSQDCSQINTRAILIGIDDPKRFFDGQLIVVS